jgi:hypothetical protein
MAALAQMTANNNPYPVTPACVPTSAALAAAAELVRKQGVSLGLLDTASRRRALALAWRCLPQQLTLAESQVNGALREFLS